jgi:probable F420-dependent oxidoreductase
LEVGVGAGWMTTDYEQAGLTLDPARTRIDRLAEALDVIEGLWGDGPCTVDGKHYRVAGLDGLPKPLQSPRPPILMGGGARRMLTLAGQRADIVGINVSLAKGVIDADAGSNGTAAATDQKVAWVRDAAGDRDVELQVRVHLVLPTDDRPAAAELFAPAFGISPEESLLTPHALVGTTDDIVEDLLARRERWGISYIGVSLDAIDTMAPVVARLRGT